MVKTKNLFEGSLIFCEPKSENEIRSQKRANQSLYSLLKSDLLSSFFCKEQQEQFAQGFLKNNERELLTVAL